jgi:integrase
MSPQRARMIDDMILPDWLKGRGSSISRRCAGWLRITTQRGRGAGLPASACASGVARSAFKTVIAAFSIFYHHTLGQAWRLFGEKGSPHHDRSGLPEAVRQLPSGIRSPAHKTCLALMYACGLRICEVITLEVGAVDRAIGKGNKERLVPLPQTVEAAWQHVPEEAAHELITAEAAGSPDPKVSLACSVNQE